MVGLVASWPAMAALVVPALAPVQAGLAALRTEVKAVPAAWAVVLVARAAQEALQCDRGQLAVTVGQVALEVLVLQAAAAAMAPPVWDVAPAGRVAPAELVVPQAPAARVGMAATEELVPAPEATAATAD